MALALGLCLAARAESRYGHGAGAGVNATARVSLSVTVPRIILLRIGSAGGTVDTVSWAVNATIPGAPPTTAAPGDGNAVTWNNALPTFTNTVTGNSLAVRAYTNVAGATLSCVAPAWSAAGGPPNVRFTVGSAGPLSHPGGNLGACASRAIARGAVRQATWTYNLSNTGAATWRSGTYTATLTYTATAP